MEVGVTVVFLSSRWIVVWRDVRRPLWAMGIPYVVSMRLVERCAVNFACGIQLRVMSVWVWWLLLKMLLLRKVRGMFNYLT